jgi:hypothetical protein
VAPPFRRREHSAHITRSNEATHSEHGHPASAHEHDIRHDVARAGVTAARPQRGNRHQRDGPQDRLSQNGSRGGGYTSQSRDPAAARHRLPGGPVRGPGAVRHRRNSHTRRRATVLHGTQSPPSSAVPARSPVPAGHRYPVATPKVQACAVIATVQFRSCLHLDSTPLHRGPSRPRAWRRAAGSPGPRPPGQVLRPGGRGLSE